MNDEEVLKGKREVLLKQYEFLRHEIVQCLYLRQVAIIGILTAVVGTVAGLAGARKSLIALAHGGALPLLGIALAFLVNCFGALYVHEQGRNRRACAFNRAIERLLTKVAMEDVGGKVARLVALMGWENFLVANVSQTANFGFYIARYFGVALPILAFSAPLITFSFLAVSPFSGVAECLRSSALVVAFSSVLVLMLVILAKAMVDRAKAKQEGAREQMGQAEEAIVAKTTTLTDVDLKAIGASIEGQVGELTKAGSEAAAKALGEKGNALTAAEKGLLQDVLRKRAEKLLAQQLDVIWKPFTEQGPAPSRRRRFVSALGTVINAMPTRVLLTATYLAPIVIIIVGMWARSVTYLESVGLHGAGSLGAENLLEMRAPLTLAAIAGFVLSLGGALSFWSIMRWLRETGPRDSELGEWIQRFVAKVGASQGTSLFEDWRNEL